VGDIDNDGLPDAFLCHLPGNNALFKNLGNCHFTNITSSAGLGAPIPNTRGAAFADVNGAPSLDLLVTVTGRGVLCFLNDGAGHFTPISWTNGVFLDETGKPLPEPPVDMVGKMILMR